MEMEEGVDDRGGGGKEDQDREGDAETEDTPEFAVVFHIGHLRN
jgi:hypothetical protein